MREAGRRVQGRGVTIHVATGAAPTTRKRDRMVLTGGRDMAANVGIRFHTPEEYFLKQAATPFVRAFEPSEYVRGPDRPTETRRLGFFFVGVYADANESVTKKHAVDIVLFCGSPGSGKSTFFTRQLKNLGYERVNQDTLKTVGKTKVHSSHRLMCDSVSGA